MRLAISFFIIYFFKCPRFVELIESTTFKAVEFVVLNETTNGTVIFSSSHYHKRDSEMLLPSKFRRYLYDPPVNLEPFTEPFELKIDERYNHEDEKQYELLIKKAFHTTKSGHTVYVIQPYIKWGPHRRRLTTPDFQLEESVALIESLPNWYVVLQQKVPLMNLRRSRLFGKGKMEEIKQNIKMNDQNNNVISAVFVSVNMLTRPQRDTLEDEFQVGVFDRYNIVLQIFRNRAITQEAKLQVALAETQFMTTVMCNVKGNYEDGDGNAGPTRIRESIFDYKKKLLDIRIQRIKRKLKQLQAHRNKIRTRRRQQELPVIAVVGYTNAGKTSLIKALTEGANLEPRSHLFATLDVTAHQGLLPANIRVLYMDTIGFISDIPSSLIEPFKVTLDDAVQADVIVHVLDASNPDVRSQYHHVIETLNVLNIEEKLLKNIITVANKVDKIINNTASNDLIEDMFHVSSVKKTGIDTLINEIERVLIQNTGRIPMRIRCVYGSPEYIWLRDNTSVFSVECSQYEFQFVFVYTVITKANLGIFKKKFNC